MLSQDVEIGAAPGGIFARPRLAAIFLSAEGGLRAGGVLPAGLIDFGGPLDRRDRAGFDWSDARHARV